jgi:hippurate hydrolase
MLGTARWFSPAVGDILETGVRRLATGIADGFGARADVTYQRTLIATVNDAAATALTVQAARTVAGDAQVQPMPQPTMGGEDFAFMLAAKQGSYIMLGAQRGPADPQVHHPKYDFNDNILPVGASYWATLAEQLLPAG